MPKFAACLACLASAMALAQVTPAAGTAPPATPTTPGPQAPPERGAFVGPVVGSTPLTFAWYNGPPYLPFTSFVPGVRAGLYFPKFSAHAQLGLSVAASPMAYSTGNLTLSAAVSPYFWSSKKARAYGLGGINLGAGLSFAPGYSDLQPCAGLDLGAGLQYCPDSNYCMSAEGGLRNQLVLGGDVEPSTSVFLTVTATLNLETRERGPGPGGTTTVPTTPTGPTPASTPRPPTYGRSVRRCATIVNDGWFEPSQAVWQDDPTFNDLPGKQLTRADGPEGVVYQAELAMVQNKATQLFGVHHYRQRGQPVTVDSRDFIVLRGVSNCTENVSVRFRFYSTDGTDTQELYTSEVVGQVPLEGLPRWRYTPWEVKLPAKDGLPPNQPFTFRSDSEYQLRALLVREDTGAETDLKVTVKGDLRATVGPIVHFIPVKLTQLSEQHETELISGTETLASSAARYIPDMFPLAPGGLPTRVGNLRSFINLDIPSMWIDFRRRDATVAAMNDALSASVFLDGAGRAIAVMKRSDFESIFGDDAAAVTAGTSFSPAEGITLSWKVTMIPHSEFWESVAHELVHTLPGGWSGKEMQALCGRDYHNKRDPVANGHRITEAGRPLSERLDGKIAIMGPATLLSDIWIAQCTYFHLLDELDGGPPDPPVLLLRAFLGKKGAKLQGELRPIYELMGYADLPAGKGGPYAFVLRNAKGAELGRFPFTPRFEDVETEKPREMISVLYRVPALPGWSQVELVGPRGTLDRKQASAQPPEIEITSPADLARVSLTDSKARVTWKATGAAGTSVLYSVLYSDDGGKSWMTRTFEQKDAASEVPVNPKGKEHWVKIIATDGTRSSEAVIRFTVSAP